MQLLVMMFFPAVGIPTIDRDHEHDKYHPSIGAMLRRVPEISWMRSYVVLLAVTLAQAYPV